MEVKTISVTIQVPKEAAEVVEALGIISKVVVRELKDGFQPTSDIPNIGMKLALNTEYRQALQNAADKIQDVPTEVKAAGVAGGIGLGMLAGVQIQEAFAELAK